MLSQDHPNQDLSEQESLTLLGVSSAACAASIAVVKPSAPAMVIKDNQVILFQGDSITDADHERKPGDDSNQQATLGNGYVWLAAQRLLMDHADAGLKIYNRGISGHKVYQLAERWDQDCLNLKPDVLSILIGVNDIWHTIKGTYAGTVEIYERDFDALLSRTHKALPHVKLVICEPFAIRCGAVDHRWFPEFNLFRAVAKRLAHAHGAIWVPFQSVFDKAVEFAPAEHWSYDGIHPSPAGNALMAYAWLRAVGA